MKDKKMYKIMMVVICFIAAGLNAYRIIKGEYSGLDIFLVVVFLIFGGIYLYQLSKGNYR